MTSLTGHTASIPVCIALALLAIPESAARRRFARLFQRTSRFRGPSRVTMVRIAAVSALSSMLLFGVGPLVAAIVVAGTLASRRRRARSDRVRSAQSVQLLEGLETVIGELRIGAHPSAAAEIAAVETTGPTAHAFAVSAARSRLGGSGAEAFRRTATAIPEELSRLAEAWQVADRHGLALAELLTATRLDLLGRRRFRDRTRAALAGARATAAVLALLPLLGIALGQLMGAAPLYVLFRSAAGAWLLPLGATLTCAGLLWTDAITAKVLR
ncbi:type II secretion system F family protein [Nocardia acidivorans]|uniref:type II secretion system F family protein n=1 Tax=Nocardia acidivorans TaxID=404580 RepID=UPI00082DBEC5|nr:type II secretion system F family protein [Nocardia acidivorans]